MEVKSRPPIPAMEQEEDVKRPMIYEVGAPGHYGACSELVRNNAGADADQYTGIWANINSGLNGTCKQVLATYWMGTIRNIEDADHNYKDHHLPLARIKKVMKADPEVKMISAEAPILFAKGCDVFITELTMRAWIHAEENKRRTLQRSDIAAALAKSDMFDFLIDIVPRDEATTSASKRNAGQSSNHHNVPPPMPPPQQMAPPPPHHQQQQHEYYIPGDHGGYAQHMYAQDPSAYGHQGPMGYEQHPAMYAPYGMQAHQMYQSQPGPPPHPQHGYRPHDGHEGEGDAEGERDYEGV